MQPKSPNDNRQAVWWSDMVVALVIKAALRSLPVDSVTSAQALAAAQILRTTAGAGTLDLMLLNANHGVLILADAVLCQPWVQAQCEHSSEQRETLHHVLSKNKTEQNCSQGRSKGMDGYGSRNSKQSNRL